MPDHVEFDVETAEKAPPVKKFSPVKFKQRMDGMDGWLISKGIAKGESMAKIILVVLVFFNFLFAGIIIYISAVNR